MVLENELGSLRSAAEECLTQPGSVCKPPPESDFPRLVHELSVHQIELQMQVEALSQAQFALEESKQHYFELFEFAPLAYINLDEAGVISELNLSSCTLLQYERGNMLNNSFARFVVPEDAGRWHLFFQGILRQAERQSCEVAVLRGDGSRLHVRLDCQPFSALHGTPQVRMALTDVADKVKLIDELYRQEVRRAKIAHHLIDIEELERRRLAMEIHDVVTPNLSAMQIIVGVIEHDLPREITQELAQRLSDVRQLIEDTHGYLRGICANLRPSALDYAGLYEAVDDFARLFSQRMGLSVVLTGGAVDERLPAKVETLLFRIVQEALTNAAKHAQASRITIELAYDGKHAYLEIVDNGVGFDTGDGRLWGLGLLTMAERAELAGGKIRFESEPGKGTSIIVEI